MTSERTIKQKVAAKETLTVPWSIICIIATAESSINTALKSSQTLPLASKASILPPSK